MLWLKWLEYRFGCSHTYPEEQRSDQDGRLLLSPESWVEVGQVQLFDSFVLLCVGSSHSR